MFDRDSIPEVAGIVASVLLVVILLWRHWRMTEMVRKYDWIAMRLEEELREKGYKVYVDPDKDLLSCVFVVEGEKAKEARRWVAFLDEEASPEFVAAVERQRRELEERVAQETRDKLAAAYIRRTRPRVLEGQDPPPHIYNTQGERLYLSSRGEPYDFRTPPTE